MRSRSEGYYPETSTPWIPHVAQSDSAKGLVRPISAHFVTKSPVPRRAVALFTGD